MSIKRLATEFPKYNIELEHQYQDAPGGVKTPTVKATVTIPEDGGRFLRRVSTNFTPGETLQDAEKLAVNEAIELILGNKQTKKLIASFKTFSLQLVPFVGDKSAPVGVKAILAVASEDGKPHRTVTSLATGTVSSEVESNVLKSVINSALGV